MKKKLISVIVPCYCEEEAIPHYWEITSKVADSMDDVDFEFLFIDDGSKDNTVGILREMAKSDKRTRRSPSTDSATRRRSPAPS